MTLTTGPDPPEEAAQMLTRLISDGAVDLLYLHSAGGGGGSGGRWWGGALCLSEKINSELRG